ncbi:MAG: hypothetical protein Q4E55_08750 [Bacteroidales bacterium]|nr:hypothetical protein [Bacteroidales bacterium]
MAQKGKKANRTIQLATTFTEEEMTFVNNYLRKYKITNRSRWMRETLLAFIHRNLEDDYPTLFNEHDMRR